MDKVALTKATLLLALLQTTACTPRVMSTAPPPPPPPTPVLEEEPLRPIERPDVAITDVNEISSPDGKTVTVTGTLINRGTGPTREVSTAIAALDKNGVVLMSARVDPTPPSIAAEGTASFSATFANRPDIDRYRVEVISR